MTFSVFVWIQCNITLEPCYIQVSCKVEKYRFLPKIRVVKSFRPSYATKFIYSAVLPCFVLNHSCILSIQHSSWYIILHFCYFSVNLLRSGVASRRVTSTLSMPVTCPLLQPNWTIRRPWTAWVKCRAWWPTTSISWRRWTCIMSGHAYSQVSDQYRLKQMVANGLLPKSWSEFFDCSVSWIHTSSLTFSQAKMNNP